MDISICIKGGNLDRCKKVVESIRNYQDRDYEICIATSNQDVYDGLDELDVVRGFTESSNPPGDFADVQNKSVEIASNEWVWLWDDDHFATVEFNPKHDLQSGVVYSNMLIEPGNRPVSEFLIHRDFGKTLNEIDFEKLNQEVTKLKSNGIMRINQVNYPVLVEKKVYENIGGVDPLFNRAYANDPDLWYRLALNGCMFVRMTDSFLYHLQGQTNIELSQNDEEERNRKEMYCNQDFVRKWGEPMRYQFGGGVKMNVPTHRGNDNYRSITGFINTKHISVLPDLEPFFDRIVVYSDKEIPQDLKDEVNTFKENLIKNSAYPEDVFDKFEFIETDSVEEEMSNHKKSTFNYLYQGKFQELLHVRGLVYEN